MRLKITSTPRETLVWCPTVLQAEQLRNMLREAKMTVLPADRWELDFLGEIPPGGDFDPHKIIDVEIGADASASLELLQQAGHVLVRHEWQRDRNRRVWGVSLGE